MCRKLGIKIDTGLQIGTARFGCVCVCYGFWIGDWFGAEVIQKYWEMCRLRVLNDCSRMFFFFGEEACAGNGWGNIIKSQSSALLGWIRGSRSHDWELRLRYWQQWSMPFFYFLKSTCRKVFSFPSKRMEARY